MTKTELEQTIKAIREIADARRHYEGDECFQALGDIRDLCDRALRGEKAPDKK